MDYRKLISLICAAVVLFSLAACSNDVETDEQLVLSNNISEQSANDDGTIDDSSSEVHIDSAFENDNNTNVTQSILGEIPGYLEQVFDDYFAVKAVVHAPIISKADVLFATYKQFSEDDILSVFYNGMSPSRESLEEMGIAYTDNGSNLLAYPGNITYSTDDFGYVKFPTENLIPVFDYFSGNVRYSDVNLSDNLGFLNKTDAIVIVTELLEQLAITTPIYTEVYAMDYMTLQTLQDERIRYELDVQESMGISTAVNPTDGYITKDAFSQDDEFYVMYFTATQNGIPITQTSYNTNAGERLVRGTTIKVSLSNDGVIEFSCNGIYEIVDVAESPSSIITMQEALQKAYEIYNSTVSTDNVTVTAIDFEYVPVPFNNNYNDVKLVPSWSFTLAYEIPSKGQSQPDILYRKVFINAITCEEVK